jgi:hypothetical protein
MQNTARRPKFAVSDDGNGIVSHAGAVLLTETARVTGLQAGLSRALERWWLPRAVHDPGKIVADLAVAVALGGDCLADAGVLRAEPALFGPVASDTVISRLAGDADAALEAIGQARAEAPDRPAGQVQSGPPKATAARNLDSFFGGIRRTLARAPASGPRGTGDVLKPGIQT